MKLRFDQNLSPKLASSLARLFPESAHVREFGLERADDASVWSLARSKDFIIVSKDEDFHQRSFLYGGPPKVIWLKLGNCTTTQTNRLLESRCAEIEEFAANKDAAFLVLS